MTAAQSALALVTVVACACGGADRAASLSVVRDSLGVRIVESKGPATAGVQSAVDTIPVADIGDASGGVQQELSGLVIPALLSDGRIVVANSGSQELKFFDAAGTWITSVGRNGDGPGEFRALGWLSLGDGDTLRTYDWRLRRVSVFSADGAYQRSYALAPPGEMVGVRPVGVLADGRHIGRTQNSVSMASKAGVQRDTSTLLVYDSSGGVVDSVGSYPGNESWIVRGDRSVSVSGLPFGRDLFVVAHHDRLYVGTTDGPHVLVLRADGSLDRVVRWAAVPVVVTPTDIDRYVARAGEGCEPGREAQCARDLEELRAAPYPAVKPAYAAVLVGSDGSLWVQRYAEPDYSSAPIFDVFDVQSVWQRTVTMPPGFVPAQITAQHVIGIWRDADDVQHVRVYRRNAGAQ